MDRYKQQAQALRRETLSGIARTIAIKWRTLASPSHAPHPRQVPAPTHT